MVSRSQFCVLAMTILCVFHVEGNVSLICDNTTDVCPGTELTCTCTSTVTVLVWNLPRGDMITFLLNQGVNASDTAGIFTAEITETPNDAGIVSVLRYNATQTVANSDIGCNDGGNDNSDTYMILEFANPPSAPGSLSAQSTTYNSATIQWTAPSDNGGSDITGYNITISQPSSGNCDTGSCTVSNVSMHTITGLDHMLVYDVSVAAINCAGTGDDVTMDGLIDIEPEPHNMPRNLMVNNTSDSSNITVEWRCPSYNPLSPPVDSYIVTVNGVLNTYTIAVASDGSCSYNVSIPVKPQDAILSVSVVATASGVENSDPAIISAKNFLNVTADSTSNNITFTFNSTFFDDDDDVTVTLNPNHGLQDGNTIGSGVVIYNLTSEIPYTYTVIFVYNDVRYAIQSTITLPTPEPTTTSMPTSSTTDPGTNGTNTGTATSAGLDTTTMIIIIVVVVVAVIAILLVVALIICVCIKVKSRAKKGDDGIALKGEYRQKRDEPEALVERPVPETGQSGPMYQDPNTIERQQAPTGDLYAMPDRSKKSVKRDPPPAASNELATYQDPNTIQHEIAPTGDMYAMPDRKQQPAGGRPEDRMYAALDFENGTGTATASTSFQKPRTQEVLYSEVQQPL